MAETVTALRELVTGDDPKLEKGANASGAALPLDECLSLVERAVRAAAAAAERDFAALEALHRRAAAAGGGAGGETAALQAKRLLDDAHERFEEAVERAVLKGGAEQQKQIGHEPSLASAEKQATRRLATILDVFEACAAERQQAIAALSDATAASAD